MAVPVTVVASVVDFPLWPLASYPLSHSWFFLVRSSSFSDTRSLLSRAHIPIYTTPTRAHIAVARRARTYAARVCAVYVCRVSRSACASISASVPRPPADPTGRCQFLVDHRLAQSQRPSVLRLVAPSSSSSSSSSLSSPSSSPTSSRYSWSISRDWPT